MLTSSSVEPSLMFDADQHRYTFGGRELLSVTRILHLAGMVDSAWFTDQARERGTYVHRALEYRDRGRLDEHTVDPRLMPYLDAYSKFMAETGVTWTRIEHRVCDPAIGCAGTVDRFGVWREDAIVVDIKTGQPLPSHPIQLAGYVQMARAGTTRTKLRRFGLYLTARGTYEFREYTSPRDAGLFTAALAVAAFRTEHGLVERAAAPREWED